MEDRSLEIEKLLEQAEAMLRQGHNPSVEELCKDRPELATELGRQLQAIKSLTRFIDDYEPVDSPVPVATWRPEKIGDYHVVDEISRGGMGVVYRCRQSNPHREVAIKVMQPSIRSDLAFRRFRLEAEVLGLLQDPGIAQIYEAGESELDSGIQPFIVMELIHGRPLDEFARENALDTGQRLELIVKVCRAVEHAHRRGVIHRDLKPANILAEDSGQPKVLDFGVARLTNDHHQDISTLCSVHGFLGSLPYMSPQQANARPGDGDVRCDVYALGVITYQLLTGCLPHETEQTSLLEFVRLVNETPAPALNACGKSFHPDLEIVVAKALEKEPSDRYQTVSQLADDLERYLAGQPVVARTSSSADRIWSWATRHPWQMVAASLTVCALAAISVAAVSWRAALIAQSIRRQSELRLEVAVEQTSQIRRREAAVSRQLDAIQRRTESMQLLRIQEVCRQNPRLAREWLQDYPAERRGFVWRLLDDNSRRHQQLVVAAHEDFTFGLAVSNDSKDVAMLGLQLRFWNCQTGAAGVIRAGTNRRGFIAYSPDNRTAASAFEGNKVRIWGVESKTLVGNLIGHIGTILCGAYSSDGSKIVTASSDGAIKVWETASGSQLLELQQDGPPAVDVRFTPNDDAIFSVDKECTVRHWNARTGTLQKMLERSSDGTRDPLLSPDAGRLACRVKNALIEIRSTRDGHVLASLSDYRNRLFSYAFTPDSRYLVVAGNDRKAVFWDMRNFARRSVIPLPGRARAIAFSADGTTMVTVDSQRRIAVIDIEHREFFREFRVPESEFTAIAFSPDSRLIAVAASERGVRVLFPGDGSTLARDVWEGETLEEMMFLADGKRIALAASSGDVQIWDWQNDSFLEFTGHEKVVRCLAESPDGTRLATASNDGTIRVWDIETGDCDRVIAAQTTLPLAIVFRPDGAGIIYAGREGVIQFFDFERGNEGTIKTKDGTSIRCLALSNDGKTLVASGMDPTIRYWDVSSRELLAQSIGHVAAVNAFAFSPDGTSLVSASSDRTIRIWDALTGDLQAVLRGSESAADDVAIAPDGRSLAARAGEQAIRFWESLSRSSR